MLKYILSITAYPLLLGIAANYLVCRHFDWDGFLKAVSDTRPYTVEGRILGAVTPHFLPVMNYTANLLQTVADHEDEAGKPIDTVIIAGPNHRGLGLPIIITDYGWVTPLGHIEADREAVEKIVNARDLSLNLNADTVHLENDHSIAVILPFVQYYLPEARVVTVMLSRGATLEELNALARTIYEISLSKNILLLASVDFSHYLTAAEAMERDAVTDSIIRAGNYRALKGLDDGYLDSPESLILLMMYASFFGGEAELYDSVILPESHAVQHIGYSYHVYVFTEGFRSKD
jgi:hypothetical protein